ncbi:HAD-IIB family hydrolase [Dubosiella muris]|uniref:HAD-IIB family hydrolase n=1 Tax=Dubosiella muris TaxID=3038133 RepID=A0AC61RAG7_9FIRM|nr:HAD-IIB family hydrolase [Dubosiella muris]TGY67270.1 HAD-IIB family hydrolase [Dubosiella muris]
MLFLSDVDGTLITYDRRMDERDIEAIRRWQADGHQFGLVTGRDLTYCKNLLGAFGIVPDCLIASNGATLFCQGQTVAVSVLSSIEAASVMKSLAKERDLIAFVTLENGKHYFRAADLPIAKQKQAHLAHFSETDVFDLLAAGHEVPKISVYVPDIRQTDCVLARLKERFAPLSVMKTSVDYVEITQQGCDKAAALHQLMERFAIEPHTIAFAGDGENDVPLFRVLERTYVMAHAHSSVQAQAAYRIQSVREALEQERRGNDV